MNTITMSAIVVTLFFGGPNGYIFHIPGATIYMPIIYFLLKTVAFCFIYVWFRAALPRLRYDQLMDLGWKRLIPMTLGWLLLVAAIVAWGWAGLILVPVVVLASVLLMRANKLGSGRSDDDVVIPVDRQPGDPGAAAVAGARPGARREGVMGVGDEVKDQLSFLGGFKLTFQHLTRPRVTTKYPDEKKPKQPRQHGRHVLNRYEDGMEKCIGCELCAGVCPADCIYVRGLDNPPDHPVSPGRALRLRLRDQLPALHPLRHVRRGLPDRGHHRVQAVRVLLHQPLRRHLHQGRARRERRRHAEEAARGRTGARATT